jgi:hypothetical protein
LLISSRRDEARATHKVYLLIIWSLRMLILINTWWINSDINLTTMVVYIYAVMGYIEVVPRAVKWFEAAYNVCQWSACYAFASSLYPRHHDTLFLFVNYVLFTKRDVGDKNKSYVDVFGGWIQSAMTSIFLSLSLHTQKYQSCYQCIISPLSDLVFCMHKIYTIFNPPAFLNLLFSFHSVISLSLSLSYWTLYSKISLT